jgi:ectoine hydroxylase-related dioxygenase (phytanoyl-CoA dioxygenase family)
MTAVGSVEGYVAALGAQGFTVIPDVFSPQEVERLRAAVEDVFAREGAPAGPGQPRFSYNLSNKHGAFREAVQHPLLIELMAALLGDDFILGALNAHGSNPGSPRQFLHRDEILDRRIPFPTHINTMWMLDDFTAENGATRVVPGSHLWAEAPVTEQVYAGETQATGTAGSVAVFDGRLFHSREANRTDRHRRGVTAYFGRSWTKPQEDHTRSVEPAIVAEATPLLIRLWGFHKQVPWEEASTPNKLRQIPAPGVPAVAVG